MGYQYNWQYAKLIILLIILIQIFTSYSFYVEFRNKELVVVYSPDIDIKVIKDKQTAKCLIEPEVHLKLGPKGNVQISYC